MWLVWVNDVVMEGNTVGSVPQATRGRGCRDGGASMCQWATRFSTLNSKIPSHSEVV